jgi:hypothetical protein
MNRFIAIAIVVFPLLASDGVIFAQRADREVSVKELLKLPGKLLAEAKPETTSGDSKPTGK